jgi:catechol 2,3-dioxygenase-like lactoylglutathione lyase family enzyme
MPIVEPGVCHRLAVAVDDVEAIRAWLTDVLGAGSVESPGSTATSGGGDAYDDLAGTESCLVGLGGLPFIALGGGAPGGPVDRHRQRYGPSMHSLAWEVADLWTTEHRLRRADIRIGAVNVPGRHFFMHPKDTHGLLLEWTDDIMRAVPPAGDGRVRPPAEVVAIEWVAAVVHDAGATASFLTELAGATEVDGLPRQPDADDDVVDVAIGDFVVRLVTPRSASSRYAAALERGPRLWSCGLRVAHLDAALGALEAHGATVTHRWPGLAVTDPASTFGVPFEWTGP